MKYVSLFAGIGGFDLALNRLGNKCVYVNEWDKYAAQIYEKNFKHKPDTRDISKVDAFGIPDHDLLVGGFPCQAFSIAGKRRGFAETRGTLFFEIARILKAKQTPWFILENVKGLLSHDNGSTFKTIISALDELGYDLQWQVLNSKNFGVPQNRERVFIIGNLRGKSRSQIFPIGENSEPDIVLPTLTSRYYGAQANGSYISKVTPTLRAADSKRSDNTTLVAQRIPLKFLNRNQRKIEGDYAFTVDSMNTGGVMVGTYRTHKDGQGFREIKQGISPTIPARAREDGSGQPIIYKDMKIRRLTPKECERLQGFPDGWTEGVSDTQRYKCLGNAVTVNVVEEIMKRFIL
jgi:DNA (cytosine-5)-methyltransferase 1